MLINDLNTNVMGKDHLSFLFKDIQINQFTLTVNGTDVNNMFLLCFLLIFF
jgi:hypothetical protein